ncbi:MAG: flavodoxin family protein [Deltaproteobacteria bacterium]|nr:MAG: flavodoxin family protein [Deltaproteobacteria bacterium]
MKSIVVYSSQTGNTKKLAEAVYSALRGEKSIYPVGEAPAPSGFDLVCVGFWLMAGKPDPKSQDYLRKVKTQKLFLFATHGASATSPHAQNAMEEARGLAPESDMIGTFNCSGEVNPKVLEKAGSKPEPPVWLDDAPNAVGHPDQADLKNVIRRLEESL